MVGWIKLHRRILDWQWYDDINTLRLWIHILLKSGTEKCMWHGIEIPSGSFVTSYSKLSEETSLTVREIRTCLSRLEECGSISRQTTNRCQIITVINWDIYQSPPRQQADNAAGRRQPKDSLTATVKEYNNNIIKEDKKLLDGYPFSEGLKSKIEEWLRYKSEKGQGYGHTGLKSLCGEIEKNAALYGEERVCELISRCMASGWSGIIFDKLSSNAKPEREKSFSDIIGEMKRDGKI